MLFKKLRSKSTSSSATPQHSLRVTSASSTQTQASLDAKHPSTFITPLTPSPQIAKETDDFTRFLEKSRKEEEKREKKLQKERERESREAERRKREVNMSPWAGRM
jgi:hypothetical protein